MCAETRLDISASKQICPRDDAVDQTAAQDGWARQDCQLNFVRPSSHRVCEVLDGRIEVLHRRQRQHRVGEEQRYSSLTGVHPSEETETMSTYGISKAIILTSGPHFHVSCVFFSAETIFNFYHAMINPEGRRRLHGPSCECWRRNIRVFEIIWATRLFSHTILLSPCQAVLSFKGYLVRVKVHVPY